MGAICENKRSIRRKCRRCSIFRDWKQVIRKSAKTRIVEIEVFRLYKPKYSRYKLTNTTKMTVSMRRIRCTWFRLGECKTCGAMMEKPKFWKYLPFWKITPEKAKIWLFGIFSFSMIQMVWIDVYCEKLIILTFWLKGGGYPSLI